MSYPLRTARVVRVSEHACEVYSDGEVRSVRFAPMFPSPRMERVSPGHLVAIAVGPDHTEVLVWRWYDAVVLGSEGDGSVRLWESAHGEVLARSRPTYDPLDPGSRAWASSGLPGAPWWVVGAAPTDVELDDVEALYTANGLWAQAFAAGAASIKG